MSVDEGAISSIEQDDDAVLGVYDTSTMWRGEGGCRSRWGLFCARVIKGVWIYIRADVPAYEATRVNPALAI